MFRSRVTTSAFFVGPAACRAVSSAAKGNTTFADIARAQASLREDRSIARTPCDESFFLSRATGMAIHLKKEIYHPTGSFKERGALTALLALDGEQAEHGVVAASAGNHALALAWHGSRLGVPVTVLMPETAPMQKVSKSRAFGASVRLFGKHIGEARLEALENPDYSRMSYINGYDDREVIAGAGTIGLEVMEQVENADAIIIPCGGGGLVAGMALAIKTLKPSCKVFAVEPANCASLSAALAAGEPVTVDASSTLADGLAVPRVGDRAFAVARENIDAVVQVDEKHIALAVLRCIEDEKLTVEGGGVAGLAAVLPGGPLHDRLQGCRVVIPLCGGNIDTTTLGRVLERGLAAEGRLVRFVATVSDRPGGISGLTKLVATAGASVKDIQHERAWLHSAVDQVRVKMVCEVTSLGHGHRLREALAAEYALQWGDALSALGEQ